MVKAWRPSLMNADVGVSVTSQMGKNGDWKIRSCESGGLEKWELVTYIGISLKHGDLNK